MAVEGALQFWKPSTGDIGLNLQKLRFKEESTLQKRHNESSNRAHVFAEMPEETDEARLRE
jgi:hypothetical protein